MDKGENPKPYDLEDRTELFAKRVRRFIKTLPRTLMNTDDARQLGRASGSVGANYLEANEALSRKDFRVRLKIARKEAKESRLFLRLVDVGDDPSVHRECANLVQEATELMNILSAILRKTGSDPNKE
jgi:four helix bundle protein